MQATLDRFCSNGSCLVATRNYGGDVVAEANALAAKPLSARVLQPGGSYATVRLVALDFLSMVLDSDLNPGLAAELPAIVHAARLGNPQPLLRVYQLDSQTSAESAPSLSSALYAATDCHDGPFPWQPDTPIPDRQAMVQAAIAALPRRLARRLRLVVGRVRQRVVLPQLAESVRRRRLPAGPVPGRADARGERRLRHAHADARRGVGRGAVPAGARARRAGRRPQRPRRRRVRLFAARCAELDARRRGTGDLRAPRGVRRRSRLHIPPLRRVRRPLSRRWPSSPRRSRTRRRCG